MSVPTDPVPAAATSCGPYSVRVCCGSACVGQGALEVIETIRVAAGDRGGEKLRVEPSHTVSGCRGWCSRGPLVEFPDLDLLYCHVAPDDAAEIVERTMFRGEVIERLLDRTPVNGARHRGLSDNPFFAGQMRRVLARCGVVDPESLDHAVALGAYDGLRRAVEELDSPAILDLVKRSGLRELGGSGFPVGLKWAVVAETPSDERYVVGSGDSVDPGLTVDRTLLEGDPHGVIEGLAIAGRAVGSRHGRLFLRSEHRLAVARAQRAVAEARARGILGRSVLGSGVEFEIEICESAGASTGGEETALLNLLQGRRAAARPRPPFPAVSGLWGRPTLISTLETLANIPLIVGPDGGGRTVGPLTKVVAVSGAVARPGLAEVPLGTSVERVLLEIAGGSEDGRELKAAHLGGPAGLTLRPTDFGTAIDHDTVRTLGGSLGSGGLVALASGSCVVRFARYLVDACARQSCGTCPPCRIGTWVVLNLLDRICAGDGRLDDLGTLERLCHHIRTTSLCEIGRVAPVVVLAGLERFRADYEAHLDGHGCRPGGCGTPAVNDTLSKGV